MARDRARRKAYWKNIKVARKLRAENFAAQAKLREAGEEASLQFYTVVSQPESENSGCLERTPSASKPNRRLTVEGDCFKPKFNLINIDCLQRLQKSIPVFWWTILKILKFLPYMGVAAISVM